MFYLYVKTHSITGLKYLGYTSSKNPYKYSGSGTYWNSHLKKHGYTWTTEILKECSSKEEIKNWGQYYSNLWKIVISNEWANLIEEKASGGDLTLCWTVKSKQNNKKARDQWIANMKGKTYDNIYGVEKSNEIKQKQSDALSGKKLHLTESERKNRSTRRTQLNQERVWSEDSVAKRSSTFKQRQCNIGSKNGMQTKPEARSIIAEKNSRTHVLQNTKTGEKMSIKNISKWAREHGLNPSTVLTKFCKNLPVGEWTRINVF
jgi:hypothetical protein